MTQVRSLPLHVPPLPGEALDSWLEALAHRHNAALGDVRSAVGLASPQSDIVRLAPDEAKDLAASTGTALETVLSMTLAQYGEMFFKAGLPRKRQPAHGMWARGRGSRYCPDCLAETGGRWRLDWRLGWSFACVEHRRLLADACPRCDRVLRQRAYPGHAVPRPGTCLAPEPGAAGVTPPRCGADLTKADTMSFPEGHIALVAQKAVLDIIGSSSDVVFGVYAAHPQPVGKVLADFRAIASRVLRYASDEDLVGVLPDDLVELRRQARQRPSTPSRPNPQTSPGLRAPAQAGAAAVGVSAAAAALGAPNAHEAGAALRWLIENARKQGLVSSATSVISWGGGASEVLAGAQLAALSPFLQASDQLRYRIATTLPAHPIPGTARANRLAKSVPTLFWPKLALRFSPPGPGQYVLRPVLSCSLMLVGTRLWRAGAAERLGSAIDEASVSRILQLLLATPDWADARAALTQLSDHLDRHGAPIDYERRRRTDYTELLPDEHWAALCRGVGTSPGTRRKIAQARCWLFETISCLPATRSPFVHRVNSQVPTTAAWAAGQTPELMTRLLREAREFLDRHGMSDEPVSWQPPPDLYAGFDLPGPNPDRVDIAELHELVGDQRLGVSAAAKRLGTTVDVVQHLLQEHPAPRAGPWAARSFTARRALSKEKFLELYHHQQLCLREIGKIVGTNRRVLSRLAREYGVQLRPAQGRARYDVDRAWLYEQYTVRGRTLPDIAREVGMSPANLNRWAKAHDIPLRARGGGSHRQHTMGELAASVPALLHPAFATDGGWERLNRFAAVSSHPTLTEAAHALGLRQPVLTMQINALERALGGPLLDRAERAHPMTLTPLGEKVVAAITATNPLNPR